MQKKRLVLTTASITIYIFTLVAVLFSRSGSNWIDFFNSPVTAIGIISGTIPLVIASRCGNPHWGFTLVAAPMSGTTVVCIVALIFRFLMNGRGSSDAWLIAAVAFYCLAFPIAWVTGFAIGFVLTRPKFG